MSRSFFIVDPATLLFHACGLDSRLQAIRSAYGETHLQSGHVFLNPVSNSNAMHECLRGVIALHNGLAGKNQPRHLIVLPGRENAILWESTSSSANGLKTRPRNVRPPLHRRSLPWLLDVRVVGWFFVVPELLLDKRLHLEPDEI